MRVSLRDNIPITNTIRMNLKSTTYDNGRDRFCTIYKQDDDKGESEGLCEDEIGGEGDALQCLLLRCAEFLPVLHT